MSRKTTYFFERIDWVTEQRFNLATENKVWMILAKDSYLRKKHLDGSDRKVQEKISKVLKSRFKSVVFLGATSVYFYFSDESDEAYFCMLSSELVVEALEKV